MKRIIALFFAVIVFFSSFVSAFAADAKVVYSGGSENFVFAPGSEHSLTDLFDNFKDVMPGDILTQKITVKNNSDSKIKVKIYLRSFGAQEGSEEFLSKLFLKVQKSEDNDMEYMFDATANETAGLTDWVCLGMLYSGGEVNLDIMLNVPVELDNEFQNKIGYLDWEFMVEEFPVEDTDPQFPQTGDSTNIVKWLVIMFSSVAILIVLLLWNKKGKNNKRK